MTNGFAESRGQSGRTGLLGIAVDQERLVYMVLGLVMKDGFVGCRSWTGRMGL